MNRTAELNTKAIELLSQGDSEGAVRTLVSALSHITTQVMESNWTQKQSFQHGGCHHNLSHHHRNKNKPRSSSFVVKAASQLVGTGIRTTSVEYFEKLFRIESFPQTTTATSMKEQQHSLQLQDNGSDTENATASTTNTCTPATTSTTTVVPTMTDEQAAYCSSICFYNMAIASYTGFKKQPLEHDRLHMTYDLFLRAFDLLAVCKLDPDDSKIILLLAICNNLAAVQAELGNLGLLQHWAEKFCIILEFADAMSHWNDASYHYFRLKHLLCSFALNAAGAA